MSFCNGIEGQRVLLYMILKTHLKEARSKKLKIAKQFFWMQLFNRSELSLA